METNAKQNAVVPCLLVLLQGLLYGFGDPITKGAYAVMPVYSLLSLRYLLALFVMMVFFGRHIVQSLRTCQIRELLAPCLFTALAYLIGNVALTLTAATSVAFLRSLSTVITPLLAALLFRERLHPKHIPVLVLCTLGLYLLCAEGGLSAFGLGEILALLDSVCLALSLLFSKRSLSHIDPLSFTAALTAASALLTTFCALCFSGGWHIEVMTLPIFGVIAYLGIVCTLFGYWLQNSALRSLSPDTVALLQCFCPVMTAFFSFVILREKLSAAGICGAVILLLCIAAETQFENQ